MEYTFCKPTNEGDYEALYKMMDSAFGDEDVRGITSRFSKHHPEMTDEHFFMMKYGDEVAAGLVLLPQKWILDGVELKVAEMGCVGTDPQHRRKRLQWTLNDEFDSYARENGFDLCVLAGIPFFYRQFGYQYAVELDYSTEIEVERILQTQNRVTSRRTTSGDNKRLQKILDQTQSRYLVHSVRTPSIWRMHHETETYGGEPYREMTLEKNGEIVGYYRYVEDGKNSTLNVRELGYNKQVKGDEITTVLAQHAQKMEATKLKSSLSHEDEMSQHLIGLGAKVNNPYAWQVKPLDLFRLLEKLKPAFERRILASKFKGLSETLVFNFFKFAVRMEVRDGVIIEMEKYYGEEKRTLGMNPYAFIQMIMGYKARQQLQDAYSDFWVRDGLDELIDIMFPRKPGYIHYTY